MCKFVSKPATLEDCVDCSFTDAVSFDKWWAVPLDEYLLPSVADVHGAPPLVSVHLHLAATTLFA